MGIRGATTQLARIALADVLYYSGALAMYRKRVMKHRAVVLVYHRIVDDPPDLLDYSPSGMTVRRDAFDGQMAYLRRHYRMASLSDLVARVSEGRPLGEGLCAVTFDDGWLDNYTHAFPILKKYHVPATIFLATNFVNGGEWFWEERLKYVLAHIVQQRLAHQLRTADEKALRATLARLHMEPVLDLTLPRFRRLLTGLVTQLRACPPEPRDSVMRQLEDLLQIPGLREPRRFMNGDEIRQMEDAGIEFGAHTVSHANLERCDLATAEAEIRESKSGAAALVKRPAPVFAYPFGKHNPAVCDLVARAGFAGAVTIRPGLVTPGADPMRLNRIDICQRVSVNIPFFACRALHFLEVY